MSDAIKSEARTQAYGALMDAYIDNAYFTPIFFFCGIITPGFTNGE